MNLHEAMPDLFIENEFIKVDLDAIYKQHSPHSHTKALEMIFAEGVKYADEIGDHNASESENLQQQLTAAEARHKLDVLQLNNLYDELKNKYESLLAKLNPVIPAGENPALAQAMGMGKVFK